MGWCEIRKVPIQMHTNLPRWIAKSDCKIWFGTEQKKNSFRLSVKIQMLNEEKRNNDSTQCAYVRVCVWHEWNTQPHTRIACIKEIKRKKERKRNCVKKRRVIRKMRCETKHRWHNPYKRIIYKYEYIYIHTNCKCKFIFDETQIYFNEK